MTVQSTQMNGEQLSKMLHTGCLGRSVRALVNTSTTFSAKACRYICKALWGDVSPTCCGIQRIAHFIELAPKVFHFRMLRKLATSITILAVGLLGLAVAAPASISSGSVFSLFVNIAMRSVLPCFQL